MRSILALSLFLLAGCTGDQLLRTLTDASISYGTGSGDINGSGNCSDSDFEHHWVAFTIRPGISLAPPTKVMLVEAPKAEAETPKPAVIVPPSKQHAWVPVEAKEVFVCKKCQERTNHPDGSTVCPSD